MLSIAAQPGMSFHYLNNQEIWYAHSYHLVTLALNSASSRHTQIFSYFLLSVSFYFFVMRCLSEFFFYHNWYAPLCAMSGAHAFLATCAGTHVLQ